MKEINSNSNKNYKLCKQLASRKHREQLNLYLIEGEHLLLEAVKSGAEIRALFLREGTALPSCGGLPEPMSLPEKLFAGLEQTENSQGMLGIAAKRDYSEPEFFLACRGKHLLVLDRIQDPGNIGTMIRTAEAAGYAGVMVLKGTGDVYAPKVVRAATGSLFRMPLIFVETPEEAVALTERNHKLLVAGCLEDAVDFRRAPYGREIALVIGNEGDGVCRTFLENAKLRVMIPMEGKVESLNAAVAAGLVMFESNRLR